MTKAWWHRVDLNHRHSGYEPLALPLSYGARQVMIAKIGRPDKGDE